MSPFNQILFPSSILRPVHMTLTEARPSLRSLVRAMEDPYYSKESHHHHHEDVFSPSFDVRESDSAFFLEGEFPGVARKEDITIVKLGPRILLVESNVTRFDIDAEWGLHALAPPLDRIPSEREKQQPSHVMSNQGMGKERDEEGTDKRAHPSEGQKENEDGLRVRLAERHVGYLQRSFTFPSAVDIEALRARLRYGLLVIMVPKLGNAKEDSQKIHIED